VRKLEDSNAWTRIGAEDGAVFFERTEPRPRAWLVPATRTLPGAEALFTIRSGRLPDGTPFDPRTLALVDAEVGELGPADPAAEAEIVHREATRIDVRTSTAADAFLVLSDAWYPGWSAHRDGAAVPVHRTDHALLGVRVPAGEHVTSFRFRSRSLRTGGAISLLALLGLVVANLLPKRTR